MPRPQDAEPPALSSDGLLDDGDVFLLLDLPAGPTVGCDTAALTVEKARPVLGFRGLYPGAHLVWVSDPHHLSRYGYWFFSTDTKPGNVRAKQWDVYHEVLADPEVVSKQQQQWDLSALWPNLLCPYDADAAAGPSRPPPPHAAGNTLRQGHDGSDDDSEAALWRRLTSHITPDLLGRVTGRGRDVHDWPVDTADASADDDSSLGFARGLATRGAELTFLLPRYDQQARPRAAADDDDGDTTALILSLADPAALLGDLQFAFLTGVHVGNAACLAHWRRLSARLLLRARSLPAARPALAAASLHALRAQLAWLARRVDGPDRAASRWPRVAVRLRPALAAYGRRLRDAARRDPGDPGPQDVLCAFAEIEALCWRHGWDLASEDGDEEDERENNQDRSRNSIKGAVAEPRRRGILDVDDGDIDQDYDDDDDDDYDNEYQPVVVELDGEGREVGLVSWK